MKRHNSFERGAEAVLDARTATQKGGDERLDTQLHARPAPGAAGRNKAGRLLLFGLLCAFHPTNVRQRKATKEDVQQRAFSTDSA